MLTGMRMRNFTSFKNETTIDLRSTGYKILGSTNVYDGILKGALFVGANASGKTNVIKGLGLLLELLFGEKVMSMNVMQCFFSKSRSFDLFYEFEIDGNTIGYSIEYSLHERCFVAETLKVNDQEVLSRVGSSGTTELTESKLFTDIDANSLLLREVYFNTKFRSQPILKKWFDFLLSSLLVDGYRRMIFSPGKFPVQLRDYIETVEGIRTINDFFQEFHFDQRIEYSNTSSGTLTKINYEQEKDIFFKREGVGEPIPYDLESLGNRNLLNLLPAFFHVIQHGGLLIIDEFSSGLHNFLEELLVRYFMKKAKNAQIFLVSHSTNLITNSLLRPDQIYAVDFVGAEGSKVKRFSTEKPREAQNMEKMYTSGIFGGLPRFNDDDPNQ